MDIKQTITSQYLASLAMLKQAVMICPDALWDADEPVNRFWQVAYHNLFYVHLYLQSTVDDFVPWTEHRDGYEKMGHLPPGSEDAAVDVQPYSKEDILDYLAFCEQEVETRVAGLDFEQESGFDWLPFDKLELQFYNIRHLQHHTGELAERLGTRVHVDVDWVGRGRM